MNRMFAIERGTCYVVFAYDVGLAIDLDEAERRLSSATRGLIRHKRRAPQYFAYKPAPIRIAQGVEPVQMAGMSTEPQMELVVYDFGAISVIYRISLNSESRLLSMSEGLYENAQLLTDSLRRVEDLLRIVEPAVSKPSVSPVVEDYLIFHIETLAEPLPIEELTVRHAPHIAQVLRAEASELSMDEVRDAMSHQISFGKDDVAIVDWNASLVVGHDSEDVLTVLEFANVQLLEMRFLDQRLDEALALAYSRLSKRSKKRFALYSDPSDLRDISQWQVDSAILFEGVNNALKLLGDQYLARLSRLAAQRFHLSDWDTSILRKLQTLEGIYAKISDRLVSRRMEVLEWIIIVLIATEIILPFLTNGLH